MKLRQCALILLALQGMLTGCSEEVDLPPTQPLQAEQEKIVALHGARAGPYPVVTDRDVELSGRDEHRSLQLNVYYPDSSGQFPLLLFSHGNWSDKNSYDRLLEHWVSHGYVVIAPNHLDCCSMAKGIFNSLRYGNLGLIQARTNDLSHVLATLAELEQLLPGLAGKIDTTRIAATGHSFGGFSAQQFGGAAALDTNTGQYHNASDNRIDAIVALSPPGPMFDEITADSWGQLHTPTLVTTGTWDIQPTFWPDWRDHLMSYERAQPGDKYALVVQGADHYLGNLICRTDREHPAQEDALTMVHIATTAFLDAYLKQDTEARALLASDTLTQITGSFAELQAR